MHSATITTHQAQGQLTKREAQATYERKRKLNDITPYGFDAEQAYGFSPTEAYGFIGAERRETWTTL